MASDHPPNAKIVADYLDSVLRKDHTAVDRFFHPDVEYMINGSPSPDRSVDLPPISTECKSALPWLGYYRGKEAVTAFLDHMHRNLDVTAYGPRRVVSEGNHSAAFGWFRLPSLSTGAFGRYRIRDLLRTARWTNRQDHFVENTFDVANTFRVGGSWLIDTDGAKHDVPNAT